MNIFLHEFKQKIRSVFIWSFSIALLILVFLSLFQSFASQSNMVSELMASFPRELLVAFGMVDMDWSNILGFFALLFVFCQICLAIQAANYGFSLVSIEESEWTADFLLSKPVSRIRIMSAKLLAALAALTITNAVVWAVSFPLIKLFDAGQVYQWKPVILLLSSVSVFQLFFLSVGMFISLLVRRVRSVTPFSMGLVFGLYILNAFGDMIGEKSLEILSPFKHFAPGYIVNHAAWDFPLMMISVGIILIALLGSYVLYQHRNISSAV
jgi:ABC-2 type transport system permease protein